MKISSKPTKHILVRANCQSEWDCCDFALITCDDYWKKEFKKKLEAISSFHAPDNFLSFKFIDCSVEFYKSTKDETEILPEGKDWEFVNLEDGEEETFAQPENQLDPSILTLDLNGSGFYKTYGKHTGEEFFTYEIPLKSAFDGIL